MELLSVLTARVLWFVDYRDLNPHGRDLRYTLFPALADKYNFDKWPYDTEENRPTEDAPGYKFVEGEFRNKDGIELTISFTIFDDGLVAETRSSTSDSEAFLDEVMRWAVKDFGLTFQPGMVHRKGYLSELNVRPSRPVSALNPRLSQFAGRLSSLVSTPEYPAHYDAAGIFLSVDPSLVVKPGAFRFERRLDGPFALDRYYSQAPVPTDIHLALLEELEGLLAG